MRKNLFPTLFSHGNNKNELTFDITFDAEGKNCLSILCQMVKVDQYKIFCKTTGVSLATILVVLF